MNNEEKQQWLDNLQEGDRVAMNVGQYSRSEYRISTVTKITPTRIIKTRNGYEFSKDGRQRGSVSMFSSRVYLQPVTLKIEEEVEREELLKEINKINFSNLPIITLRKVVEQINLKK